MLRQLPNFLFCSIFLCSISVSLSDGFSIALCLSSKFLALGGCVDGIFLKTGLRAPSGPVGVGLD